MANLSKNNDELLIEAINKQLEKQIKLENKNSKNKTQEKVIKIEKIPNYLLEVKKLFDERINNIEKDFSSVDFKKPEVANNINPQQVSQQSTNWLNPSMSVEEKKKNWLNFNE